MIVDQLCEAIELVSWCGRQSKVMFYEGFWGMDVMEGLAWLEVFGCHTQVSLRIEGVLLTLLFDGELLCFWFELVGKQSSFKSCVWGLEMRLDGDCYKTHL